MPGISSKFVRSHGPNRSGNMLAIVVAILFILVVLVMGLHTSQTRATHNVTQAEAELQFRQGFEFEVARLLSQSEPVPSWVRVVGRSELLADRSPAGDYSKDLFTEQFPNFDPDGQQYAPGFATYKVNPQTSDDSLKVFAGKYQNVVTQSSGGYAVYAPKGRVTLSSATGWSNPTLKDDRESMSAYSGVLALIACKSDLEIEKLTYGMAYSSEGSITLGGQQGGIGFQGHLPLRAYETKLKADLDSLKSNMANAAASGDKTGQIEGDAFQTIAKVISFFFGSGDPPSVTLEQAMKVPFPLIPGFASTIPGLFYEFWFHMPYPPDFSSFDGGGRDAEADEKRAKKLKEDIDRVKAELAALREKYRNETNSDKRKDIQKDIDNKQKELDKLEKDSEDFQKDIEDNSKKNEKEVEGKIGSSPEEPVTRRDDKNIPKTGIKGWSYGPIFENFFGLLFDLFGGNIEGIAKRFINEVRVVHFGGMDKVPDFNFDNGFYAEATFNIPAGRSFRFRGDCEFRGDLWLQKGSLMHVGGNLTLSNPNAGTANPFLPTGKLVLEEGATLVVDGNVTLAGSHRFGSLWVCSEAGKLRPISTAILASGTVTIPHGSYTSTNLEDTAKWISSETGAPGGLSDVLGVLLTDVAPNLSKIAGPFHTRKPFFASYAATAQLTMVPTPVGTIPVPTLIPLPRKNVLITVFRGFTYVYTPTLNALLGENLYTHASWWGFGEGVVPVLPKLDPIRMAKSLVNINLGSLDLSNIKWETQLGDLVKDVLEGAMQYLAKQIVQAIVSQLAQSAIPGGGFVIDTIMSPIIDKIGGNEDFLAELQEKIVKATVGPIIDRLESWIKDIEKQVEDGLAEGFLREVNGPLIYANSILVGESSQPRLMVGMLVAQADISVEARIFVGSMLCLDGDVSAKNVFFNPHFTRASLYKPKATRTDWLTRVVEFEYGKRFNSNSGIGLSTGVNMVRAEGWNR